MLVNNLNVGKVYSAVLVSTSGSDNNLRYALINSDGVLHAGKCGCGTTLNGDRTVTSRINNSNYNGLHTLARNGKGSTVLIKSDCAVVISGSCTSLALRALDGYISVKVDYLVVYASSICCRKTSDAHELCCGLGYGYFYLFNLRGTCATNGASTVYIIVTKSCYYRISSFIAAHPAGVSGITVFSAGRSDHNRVVIMLLVNNNLIHPSVLTLCLSIETKHGVNSKLVALNRLVAHCIVSGRSIIGVETVDADLVAVGILKVKVTVGGVVNVSYNTGDIVLLSGVSVLCEELTDGKSLRNGKSGAFLRKHLGRALIALVVAVLVSVAGSRDDNVSLVGNLSKSLISPSCATVGAVPVCYVTVSGTGSSLSLNSYDSVSCIGIGELVANRADLIARIGVGVSCGKLNCLEVSVESASLVKPSLTASLAVPVLDVTHSGTSRSYCLYVSDSAMSHRKNYCLEVGVESAICIKPCLTASLTVPVSDVTVLVAGGCKSINSGNGAVSHRKNYCLEVGVKSAICIKPCLTASLTVPVSYVTVLVAGSVLSLNSYDLAVSHGKNYCLEVGVKSAICIKPCLTANLAVPVSDVTVLVAGRCKSINSYDLVCGLNVSPADGALAAKARIYVVLKVVIAGVAVIVRVSVNVILGSGIELTAAVGALAILTGSPCAVLVTEALNRIATVGAEAILASRSVVVSTAVTLDLGVTLGAKTALASKYVVVALTVGILTANGAGNDSTVSSALGTYVLAGREEESGVQLVGSLSIAEVSAASGALPILVVTVLKAVSRNYSCNVVQGVSCRLDSAARANAVSLAREAFVGVAGCRNDNAHAVSNESKSLVKPSAAAVGAGPVCNVSVLGTGCCLSLNSYDSVSCIGIGELATYHTVSVAGEHVGVTKCRNNNVLLVGKLSKSLITPICTPV